MVRSRAKNSPINYKIVTLDHLPPSFFLDYHKVFFCTFIVTSEIYMMMSYYLNKHARRDSSLNSREMKSLALKRNLCVINVVSILLATYFFLRHNERCEGGSKYETTISLLNTLAYFFIQN